MGSKPLCVKINSPELREYLKHLRDTTEVNQLDNLNSQIRKDPTYRYMIKEHTAPVHSRCHSCYIRRFCKSMIPHRYLINQRDCIRARKYVALRLIERYGEEYRTKLAELLQK